jgi:TetR/AcrR family transcriptional regulator
MGEASMGPTTHNSSKEELILEAAEQVFVEKGLSGARMQEIADRAGINKTLLHYYFRTKENIFARILRQVFSTFLQKIDASIPDDAPFPAALRMFIDSFVDYIAGHPKIPMFVMQELSRGGGIVSEVLAATLDRISFPNRFLKLISQEVEAGRLEAVDPAQTVITVLGSCIYYFVAEPIIRAVLSKVQPDLVYDRAAFVARRKEEIFKVIYYGLKKRGSGDAD